jgi:hypothetical protein
MYTMLEAGKAAGSLMETTFNQSPSGFHQEMNEDGCWYNHPGYEKILCKVCHKPYIQGKGQIPNYNCGDPKCQRVK